MRPLTYILALFALSLAAPAAADEGTHFLVQVTGGVNISKAGTAGAVVGAGGRLGAVRIYALFDAEWASAAATGSGATGAYTATLNGADFAGGVRVLLPINDILRVYADVLGGGTLAVFNLDRAGLSERSSYGRCGLLDVAAGVDLRLLRELSVGVRAKVHALDETPGWLSAQHVDVGRFADLTLGVTMHF